MVHNTYSTISKSREINLSKVEIPIPLTRRKCYRKKNLVKSNYENEVSHETMKANSIK